MDSEKKLQILADSSKYDVSCCGGTQHQVGNIPGVYYASGKNGKVIPILKTLFTNSCINNCRYCANRIARDTPRISFTPNELADTFYKIYRRHSINGLFLSSGIEKSPEQTMQKMIDTAAILRYKHHFRGYIHLKILPGVHASTIKKALRVATRVSVNIESPSPKHLEKITTGKDFNHDILDSMEIIKNEIKKRTGWVDQTTQFIVGASNETDQEITKTMHWLRENKGLHRTYFSAFSPIDKPSTKHNLMNSFIRKNRLYQVEFLFRLYKFSLGEIYFNKEGKIPNNMDPKLNYALHNLDKFPTEINKASFTKLLHIPGIGKITAQKIIEIRKEARFTSLLELKNIGVSIKRAAPFILINGKKQGSIKNILISEQLPLSLE